MAKQILIADGDQNMVVSLDFLMRREGHQVRLARNGQEVLELLAQSIPDLVLLDVMLPGKSGFEVLQALRSRPDWEKVPVVVLSSKARDTDIAKGMALGASAYITKPFSTQELVSRVSALMDTKEA